MADAVNPHPAARPAADLIFPDPVRQRRVRFAGAGYLLIGALLLTAWHYSGDGFWLFGGLIGAVVGMGLLGFREQVRVSRATRQVSWRRGFLIDFRRRTYSWDHFRGVEVRRRTVRGQRFSRISGRTWETTLNTRYEVVLVNGGASLEVEASEDPELARGWAEELGEVLRLPVAPGVQAEPATEPVARRQLPPWAVWLLVVLTLVALLGWIGWNIYQAEQSVGL